MIGQLLSVKAINYSSGVYYMGCEIRSPLSIVFNRKNILISDFIPNL